MEFLINCADGPSTRSPIQVEPLSIHARLDGSSRLQPRSTTEPELDHNQAIVEAACSRSRTWTLVFGRGIGGFAKQPFSSIRPLYEADFCPRFDPRPSLARPPRRHPSRSVSVFVPRPLHPAVSESKLHRESQRLRPRLLARCCPTDAHVLGRYKQTSATSLSHLARLLDHGHSTDIYVLCRAVTPICCLSLQRPLAQHAYKASIGSLSPTTAVAALRYAKLLITPIPSVNFDASLCLAVACVSSLSSRGLVCCFGRSRNGLASDADLQDAWWLQDLGRCRECVSARPR